ncbi:MAG: hypothetical protein FWD00_03960, partial [Clostridiales bacterium]|nr:hypothetical protein [Clostridiales bacterium]
RKTPYIVGCFSFLMKGARTRKGVERPQNAPVKRFAARRRKPAERAGAGRQMRSICESPSGRFLEEWDFLRSQFATLETNGIGVLTGQPTQRNASTYWAVLKKRLAEEGANELLTNCQQLGV